MLCLNTLINSVYAVRTPFCCQSLTYLVLFHGPFPYLGSEHQVFILQVLRSCASSLCTPVPLTSFRITSLYFSFGLPIFQGSFTSIFHIPITISSSVFLSTWPNHLSLASLIFLLAFTTPALAHISSLLIFSILFSPISHLNIQALTLKNLDHWPRGPVDLRSHWLRGQ